MLCVVYSRFGSFHQNKICLHIQMAYHKIKIMKEFILFREWLHCSQGLAQIIFLFLWDHWAHSGCFESRIRLKPMLEGRGWRWVGWGAAYTASQITLLHMKETEPPISVPLFVLCFQRQPFRFFIPLRIYLYKHLLSSIQLVLLPFGGHKTSPRTSL